MSRGRVVDGNPVRAKRRKAVLLSNYRTMNLGNEALTTAVEGALATVLPGWAVIGIGRPSHGAGTFPRQMDEFARFWNQRVARDLLAVSTKRTLQVFRHRKEREAAFSNTAPGQRYVGRIGSRRRSTARWILRNGPVGLVSRWYADLELRADLRVACASELVIYNPAGEINHTSSYVPLMRLHQIAVAQAAGVPSAIVNFTFEPADEFVEYAARRTLPLTGCVIVRDVESADALRSLGVSSDKLWVLPDAVFLVEGATDGERESAAKAYPEIVDAYGIVFNHKYAGNQLRAFVALVEGLRLKGRVVLLSNEPVTDGPHLEAISRSLPGGPCPVIVSCTGHRQYVGVMANLRALCTSRLHSAILAMVTGTPVVVLENGGHKFAGAMRTAGLQGVVVDASCEEWEKGVSETLDRVKAPSAMDLSRIRAEIRAGYDAALPPWRGTHDGRLAPAHG